MSLRARLTLIMCLTVAVAVVAVSLLGYAAVRRQLLSEVDRQLEERADLAVQAIATPSRWTGWEGPMQPRPQRGLPPANPFGDVDTSFQVLDESGSVVARPGDNSIVLPVDDIDRQLTTEPRGTQSIRTVSIDGANERLLTIASGGGSALQVSRSLASTDDTLSTLTVLFAVVGGTVVAVALGSGLLITRRSLRPIGRLTDAAEQIARTQDVTMTIEESGRDEVGRLSAAFNEMLQTLATARAQQQQLVADASHELRTPLTALRTNIEVLSRAADHGRLDDAGTRALMSDVRSELEALSVLVAEIVDVAGDISASNDQPMADVDLGELVELAAARAGRRYAVVVDVTVSDVRPTVGSAASLDRAISNLLDNAAKWDRSGRPIEARVDGRRVEVRDHGTGLSGADPTRIFDRFHRGEQTQATPGSGLGLAIVKQVIERHGGTVFASDADGGGAVVGFELPAPRAEGRDS